MNVDGKYTVWQRFSVPESHEEELKKFLKENPEASFDEIYDWAVEQDLDPTCETLDGTGPAEVQVANLQKRSSASPFERVSTEAGMASVIKEIQERTAFPGFMKDWTPEQMVEAVVSWCENQIPTVVTAWWLKMDDPLGDSVMLALDPQTIRGKCIRLVQELWCEEKAEELRKAEFDSAEWQETWQEFKSLMVATRNNYYEYGTEPLGSPERGRRLIDLLGRADSVTAVTELLNRHKLVFVRQEGLSMTTSMYCEFRSEDGVTPGIEQLKTAVTRWLNETAAGRKAWLDSCEDFNIGDLASHSTSDLLAPYGLYDLHTEGADTFVHNFDTVLNIGS